MELLSRKKGTSPLGYATALFGITILTQLFHAYNFSYYVDGGLVDMGWATACKIIFIVVDWLNDVIFGALSEKTHSKWGKRMPWIIGDLLLLPVFVVASYAVSKGDGWSMASFAAFYILISVSLENSSTVMYTNYNALFPTLFTSTASRAKTASYKHVLEIVAMGLCYVLTPILLKSFSYLVIGFFYTGIYLLSMLVFFLTINIKDDVKAVEADTEKYSFKEAVKDCFKDKPFVLFNVAQSFFAAIMSIAVTLYPMYCKYVLNVDGWQQSVVFICFFGAMMAFIPVWYRLIRKFGYVHVWLASFIGLPLVLFTFAIPQPAYGFWSGCIVCALVGIFFGGLMLSPDMLFAELIDIDRIKHHIAREAALGSISTLIQRISVIVAAVVTALITYAFDYQSGTNPGPNPTLAFSITFGVFMPIIGICGALFAIWYVKASRKDRMVLHELKRKDTDNTTELNINEVINETRR
jgi:GPH family glycoside/pentoside/hexuronide:cation symporter